MFAVFGAYLGREDRYVKEGDFHIRNLFILSGVDVVKVRYDAGDDLSGLVEGQIVGIQVETRAYTARNGSAIASYSYLGLLSDNVVKALYPGATQLALPVNSVPSGKRGQ